MDVNLSSIGILFAGTTGSGSTQPESTTTIKTSRSHRVIGGGSRHADSYQAGKTDNNGGNSRDGLAESSPPDFSRMLREERTRRTPPDNIAEIKPPRTRRQNDGTIEAKTQFPLPADIPALNLSPSVGAEESMKAAATFGTSPPYVWRAGLKPILSDVSNGASAGLKEQARVVNTGKEPALSTQEMQCLKSQSRSPKLTVQPASDQGEPAGGKIMTALINGKKPLISNFADSSEAAAKAGLELAHSNDLNSKQRLSESRRKPQWATEKTTEHKSTSSQGLAKSIARETQTGDGSANSRSRGPNGMRSEICSAQTKTASPDKSGYSFHTFQTVLSEQSSTLSQTTRIVNDAPPGNAAGSISPQIAVSIEGSLRQGDTNLTIYLNPPELGKVLVRFQQQQDQITILLEASKPETRREIELTLPQIMRSLQDSGVQIRRLEVSAPSGSDELEQQLDAHAPGQDNSETTQHHFTGESDSDLDWIGVLHSSTNDEESFHEWLTSTVKDRHQDDFAPPLVSTGGSINMLI